MALLRTPPAAEQLGISVRDLIQLLDDGSLRRRRDGDGHLVVDEADLDAYEAGRP